MHLHHCRYCPEHLRMLVQSVRALGAAPKGPGSIWKNFEALFRLTGVSGRFTCGFWTDLDLAVVDCKVEYFNAYNGIVPESHTIWF